MSDKKQFDSLSSGRFYSLVDLFAGCGGLSLGFENSGFTPVFVNELNEDALQTYLMNRHHSLGGQKFSENKELISRDANELDFIRLDRIKSVLSDMSETNFHFERALSKRNHGGSTIDVIAGGPPCQGYSGIGHRRSYSVDKEKFPSNHLYVRMAEIIRYLRPRIFLFENVKGLLFSKWTKFGNKRIWPDVLSEFRSIEGYEVRWKLVHAKDYGVPQNRPRVLMVGIRKDIIAGNSMLDIARDPEDAVECGFLPPKRDIPAPDLIDLLDDLVDPLANEALITGKYRQGVFATHTYPKKPSTEIQKYFRKPSPNMKKGEKVRLTEQVYSKHKPEIVKKFLYMLSNDGEIPQYLRTKKFAQRVLPSHWGATGPTITVTSMPDDYVHYSQPRVLTVREWARLQYFPDGHIFSGKRTTGGIRRAGNPLVGIYEREVPKYTQIGNAVPVLLAERIGIHFRTIIDTALA